MRKKLSDTKINQILNSTRSSLEIEGLYPSKGNDEICRIFLNFEISELEAKALILKSLGYKA